MSLITRCPACGTMFKVVTDQLKVSQGWVRCGHCSEVFDASVHLQTDTTDSPAQAQVAGAASSAFHVPLTAASAVEAGPQVSEPGLPGPDFDPAGWKQQQYAAPLDEGGTLRLNEQGMAVRLALPVDVDSQDSQNQEAVSTPDAVVVALAHETREWAEKPQAPVPAPEQLVSFVLDARRRAHWRQPAVRLLLGLTTAVLTVLLVLQVMVQQRDWFAASEPRLKPILQALCQPLHCSTGPLQRIESLVIDSSSFRKLGSDAYRLGVSLKNTGAVPVAMPHLEVTLTDLQDQALIRRVLTPAQWGASGDAIAAGGDFVGGVIFQVPGVNTSSETSASAASADAGVRAPAGPLPIAGYRVLAFYP